MAFVVDNDSQALLWQGKSLRLSNYNIGTTPLGKGSTASVYYARRSSVTNGPSEIALKVMPDQAKLAAEVSVLAKLQSHPNIIDFYGACLMDQNTEEIRGDTERGDTEEDNHTPAHHLWGIQLELCKESLDNVVSRHRLSEYSAHSIGVDVLSGLAHMHKLGFVHRDVKPENVLLTTDGFAKLTDFGISAHLSDEVSMKQRCGTPGFAAPELLQKRNYGIKVDSFSSGALLYYSMSGRLAFSGSGVDSILRRTITDPVNFRKSMRLECLSDGCKKFITNLLIKDPEQRPDACKALQLMLHGAADEAGWQPTVPSPSSTSRQLCPRKTPTNFRQILSDPTPCQDRASRAELGESPRQSSRTELGESAQARNPDVAHPMYHDQRGCTTISRDACVSGGDGNNESAASIEFDILTPKQPKMPKMPRGQVPTVFVRKYRFKAKLDTPAEKNYHETPKTTCDSLVPSVDVAASFGEAEDRDFTSRSSSITILPNFPPSQHEASRDCNLDDYDEKDVLSEWKSERKSRSTSNTRRGARAPSLLGKCSTLLTKLSPRGVREVMRTESQ